MACILLWSSAVRVHDSQAYSKMDVTRERISRILELREILRENSLRPYNLTVRTVRRKGVLQPQPFSRRFVDRFPTEETSLGVVDASARCVGQSSHSYQVAG